MGTDFQGTANHDPSCTLYQSQKWGSILDDSVKNYSLHINQKDVITISNRRHKSKWDITQNHQVCYTYGCRSWLQAFMMVGRRVFQKQFTPFSLNLSLNLTLDLSLNLSEHKFKPGESEFALMIVS